VFIFCVCVPHGTVSVCYFTWLFLFFLSCSVCSIKYGHLPRCTLVLLFSFIGRPLQQGVTYRKTLQKVVNHISFLVGPVWWYYRTGPQCPPTHPVSASSIYAAIVYGARGLGSVCYSWCNSPVLSGVLCEFKYASSNPLFSWRRRRGCRLRQSPAPLGFNVEDTFQLKAFSCTTD
jgi:hypothetical protein